MAMATRFYMGDARTNGSGTIPLLWPDIPTLSDMDILKVQVAKDANHDYQSAPYGTGNYAIATALSPRSGELWPGNL